MTIQSQTSRIAYIGDGVVTAFSVPFYFAANADLIVILQNTLGNQVVQVLGTNYNLTGATISTGGTCTFVTAPTAGYLVTVYRDPAVTQTTSYNNNDPFPAKSHELALDKLTTIAQRVKDLVGRTIHQTEGEGAMTTALGTIATRKNKLLGFGSNGELTYVLGPTFVNSTATGVAEVDSRATAQVTIFAVSVNVIQTHGLVTVGDGGGRDYVRGTSGTDDFTDGGAVSWKPVTVATRSYNIFDYIPVSQQAAIINGTTTYDATTAIQAAITAAAGAPLYFPSGTYIVTSQLTYITTSANDFVAGLKIIGDGEAKVYFDNRVAGNALTSAFTTTNTSPTVGVIWASHGKVVGDVITIRNSSAVGGLNMDGSWAVATVPDSGHLTFTHASNATSTVAVGTGSATITKAMLRVGTNTASKFQRDVVLKGFTIKTTTNPIGSSGIELRSAYRVKYDANIIGLSGDGICIPCVSGDPDGCNQLVFDGRVESCACWGFIIDNPIHNEVSGVTLGDFFITLCGTDSANASPPSGGLKWKGQGIHFAKAFFTTNENCAMYFTGGPGASNSVTFDFLVLENNKKIAWLIEGAIGIAGKILQLYQNDTFTATYGVKLDGTTSVVRDIFIDLAIIRVTTGNNPHTAFYQTGPNVEQKAIKVRYAEWLTYDGTGQVRYNGWDTTRGLTVVASSSGATSIGGTRSVIAFALEEIDTHVLWTGTQITLPDPGAYRISATVGIVGLTTANTATLQIEKNAAAYSIVVRKATGATNESFQIDDILYGAKGDVVTVAALQDSGSAKNSVAGATTSRIAINRV